MSATIEETIKIRWDVASTRVSQFAAEEYPSTANSKAYYRITRSIQQLAVRLVDNEVRGDSEEGSLDALTDGLWLEVESRLIAWGVEIERARETRRVARSLMQQVIS